MLSYEQKMIAARSIIESATGMLGEESDYVMLETHDDHAVLVNSNSDVVVASWDSLENPGFVKMKMVGKHQPRLVDAIGGFDINKSVKKIIESESHSQWHRAFSANEREIRKKFATEMIHVRGGSSGSLTRNLSTVIGGLSKMESKDAADAVDGAGAVLSLLRTAMDTGNKHIVESKMVCDYVGKLCGFSLFLSETFGE